MNGASPRTYFCGHCEDELGTRPAALRPDGRPVCKPCSKKLCREGARLVFYLETPRTPLSGVAKLLVAFLLLSAAVACGILVSQMLLRERPVLHYRAR